MDTLRLLTRGSGIKWRGEIEKKTSHVPSAGDPGLEQSNAERTSQKRKRDDFEDKTISEEEIRTIHKQHKIRITNLRLLQQSKDLESRKSQKQHSKIFPQPLYSFSRLRSLHVISKLISNVAEQGFTEPTEVQIATIPLLLQQNEEEPDLLTVAPTGSGKTLAFLIPLVNNIIQNHAGSADDAISRHVSAVILAPTKELVSQIVNEGRKLTAGTGVRITAFRKGMRLHDNISTSQMQSSEDESEEEQKSSRQPLVKADILVSTPLSLVHALSPSEGAEPLPVPQIEHLILDEADVLLDPLFRDQTSSIWSACSNPKLRTSLWSATIGSNIEEFAIKTLLDRQKALSIRNPPPLLRVVIGLKDTSLPSISHKLVYASTEPGKLIGLRQLLHPPSTASKSSSSSSTPVLRPPFLVFTQTIDRATALHRELLYDIPNPSNSSTSGISRIAVLHSSLSSSQRNTIMTNFRLGKIWILITTDLLSRGVDFRGVNGVVNYDIPTTAASYIHRAGRTGRAGREGGVCVTFYTRDDIKYLKVIANIIAASEREGKKQNSSEATGLIVGGMPSWLLQALPDLTKADRKDLKTRGVEVRRGAKESDTAKERRKKGKNRIGTTSGYERRAENRKRGAIEGSKRRKRKDMDAESEEEEEEEFGGFD